MEITDWTDVPLDTRRALVVFALNTFGDGGPVATVDNLQFFTEVARRDALINMVNSGNCTEYGLAAARALIKKLDNARA